MASTDQHSVSRERRPRNRTMASTDQHSVSGERRPRKVNRIGKLGDDLLIEILIRSFPNPRSACRSKAVCKRWSSVISDPRFNRRFVSHQLQHPPLLLSSKDPESIIPSFLPMPSSVDPELRFVVLDAFQDLLLCGLHRPGPGGLPHGELGRTYFVCNPFTKQWIALPLAPARPLGHSELVARLVCEPRISYNLDLGGGGDQGQAAVVYSEYRFRVVCVYELVTGTRLDVFCFESGKWIKDEDALVLHGHLKLESKNVVSCDGELFWAYRDMYGPRRDYAICAFNPFRLDTPYSRIATPHLTKPWWDISVSQGALHLSVFEGKPTDGRSSIASSVWRLKEDRKSFSLVCKGALRTSPRSSNVDPPFGLRLDDLSLESEREVGATRITYKLENICSPYLHPEKPEIVFFRYLDLDGMWEEILSCDLREGVLKFYSDSDEVLFSPRWALFRAMVPCWPTSIPKYEKLRGTYNGSYGCWVQRSKPKTTSKTRPTRRRYYFSPWTY